MSYSAVEQELAAGTPPEMLCATCPWDRLCVKPPAMSAAEVEAQIEKAKARDAERDPDGKAMPVGMLMTTLVFAGKSNSGEMCPVFALRLRSPEGRQLADSVRSSMRQWGETNKGGAADGQRQ